MARRALSLFLVRTGLAIRRAPQRGRSRRARWFGPGRLPPPPPPPRAAVAGLAALVAGDLGGGPAEAGADLVGDDLDLRALVALVGLPRALLEAAGDDDAGALRDGLAHVLAELGPAGDVEERDLLLPLLGLAVLPAAVDGQAEGGDAPARTG